MAGPEIYQRIIKVRRSVIYCNGVRLAPPRFAASGQESGTFDVILEKCVLAHGLDGPCLARCQSPCIHNFVDRCITDVRAMPGP